MFVPFDEITEMILQKYFIHLKSKDSFLSKIGFQKIYHNAKIIYNTGNDQLITGPIKTSYEMSTTKDDVVNFNLEKISENLYNLADYQIQSLWKMITNNMDDITSFTGNIVESKVDKNIFENFLKLLDMIDFDFDETGKPIFPTLIGAPDIGKKLSEYNPSDEEKSRLDKIIEEKQKKYYAKIRTRRLSFIDK